jgi:hypothetical protein
MDCTRSRQTRDTWRTGDRCAPRVPVAGGASSTPVLVRTSESLFFSLHSLTWGPLHREMVRAAARRGVVAARHEGCRAATRGCRAATRGMSRCDTGMSRCDTGVSRCDTGMSRCDTGDVALRHGGCRAATRGCRAATRGVSRCDMVTLGQGACPPGTRWVSPWGTGECACARISPLSGQGRNRNESLRCGRRYAWFRSASQN